MTDRELGRHIIALSACVDQLNTLPLVAMMNALADRALVAKFPPDEAEFDQACEVVVMTIAYLNEIASTTRRVAPGEC